MAGKRRRWLALSIRAMLVVIVAVALCLAWWVNAAREQQAAVAAMRARDTGANIQYEGKCPQIPDGFWSEGKAHGWWPPAWLERQLGADYFHPVVTAAYGEGPPAPVAPPHSEVIRRVARLRHLTQLALYAPADDADVERIARIPAMKILNLGADCPKLTDASMHTLSRTAALESLTIRDAPITDAGVAALAGMPRLRSLTLGDADPFLTADSRFAINGAAFARLAGLPALTVLEIHSEALTGDGLKRVGSLRKLKRLHIRGGRFSDDDLRFLAGLVDLEQLNITGAHIDGTGFRHLSGLSKLSEVCLEGDHVGDAAMLGVARLPALKSVMIYGTRVTAAGLEVFGNAPRLKQMGLIPAVPGDTKRLKRALPNCSVLNGGVVL